MGRGERGKEEIFKLKEVGDGKWEGSREGVQDGRWKGRGVWFARFLGGWWEVGDLGVWGFQDKFRNSC